MWVRLQKIDFPLLSVVVWGLSFLSLWTLWVWPPCELDHLVNCPLDNQQKAPHPLPLSWLLVYSLVTSRQGYCREVCSPLSFPRNVKPLMVVFVGAVLGVAIVAWGWGDFDQTCFDSFPWVHLAVRLYWLPAYCCIVFSNVLRHKLLHKLIQVNFGSFEEMVSEVSVWYLFSSEEGFSHFSKGIDSGRL